jgi:protein arginine kinase activator
VAATGTVHLHLCEKCAAEKGVETTVAVPKKHPLGDFLQAVQAQGASQQGDSTRCPFCSSTLRDFRASGRLGCARCYPAFESSLRDLLRRVHGNSKHVGRAYQPPRPELFERANTLVELRERLQRAIDTEQFELAADLRDRIRVME